MGQVATDALLRQLVQHIFGPRTEIATCVVAQERQDYRVLLAHLRQPDIDVSIKLAGPDAPYAYPFDRTAMLHHLVAARTSLPVPEILAVDTTYSRWPWRILITRILPGQEWQAVRGQMDAAQLRDAYEQIGLAAAELHALHFPAFGQVRADGQVEACADLAAAFAAHARRIVRSPRLVDLFLSALDRHTALLAVAQRPCLCHEDLHGHNLIFRQEQGRWRLAAVLDFDKAWAGHHEMDLARLELWTGMIGDGFWPAYRAAIPIDEGYPQRRPLYQLLWCLEYAQNSPQHLADTRRLCRELGLPEITAFE